MEQTIK